MSIYRELFIRVHFGLFLLTLTQNISNAPAAEAHVVFASQGGRRVLVLQDPCPRNAAERVPCIDLKDGRFRSRVTLHVEGMYTFVCM